jgi:hypothetical protein
VSSGCNGGEGTIPCDVDFHAVEPNATLNIGCIYDLEGETIALPSNVAVEYFPGGEIVNGTLVFEGGTIDGRLLNYLLFVEGSVTLKSPTFVFEPPKWDMTEGEVSDEIALRNKEMLQRALQDTKSLGATVFQIDALDAYFLVTDETNLLYARDTSIKIPSDFTLQMTENTHLRVQPNRYVRYVLLHIRGVSNVNIQGGNLYGDREQHDYTPIVVNDREYTTHEWGHLIDISTGVNVAIADVTMQNATGDGINIHSLLFTFDPDYVGSNNITISDCVFESSRRNNLSITDGYNILVENNTFLNAGIDTEFSEGTNPRYAIDVEAHRSRDENGELILYQVARDITIRNNTERGSVNGSFIVAIGQDVTIENNTTEGDMGFSLASGVIIRNNQLTGSDRTSGSPAMVAGSSDYSDTVYNNEISGNTIENYATGMVLYSQDVTVFENTINDCKTGISISDLKDAEIYSNTITSERETSYGIFAHVATVDNVLIRNNIISVPYKPIAFVNVNIEEGQENNVVTVRDNDLSGGEVSIHNSNGIVVSGNY